LNDFSVDLNTTFRLKQLIPHDIPVVSESGLKNAAELQKLEQQGITAALIGESLMRAGAQSNMLRSMREPSEKA
jgi:indole-3-glycerol phosphate synthase